jgi:hypothetical protein
MLKPENVHPTHLVYDDGWYISDPRCIKCGYGVEDINSQYLTIPCLGRQGELFMEGTAKVANWV